MTRRTLSTPRALLVLGLALLFGAGTGVAAHALTEPAAPPGSASGADPRSGPPSGILGAGNVLATTDFRDVGWNDVEVDVLANGEPQYLYACERRQLAATGFSTSTINGSWTRRTSLSGGETVAELTSPPQTRSLFATLTRWYEQCTPGRPGTGRVTPSTPLGTVDTHGGTARIWRVGSPGDPSPTYAVLARDAYRIGLVDLYSDVTPPDPAGLRDLATSAVERLG